MTLGEGQEANLRDAFLKSEGQSKIKHMHESVFRFLNSTFIDVRDLPYRIPLSSSESDFSCVGKCNILRNELTAKNVPVRPRICWFRWSDIPIPPVILKAPHDDACTHLYLEAFIENGWRVLDPTWDAGLKSVLPVSVIDPQSLSTSIGVSANKILSPEESRLYMDSVTPDEELRELERSRRFLSGLNTWLEEVRAKK